MQESPQSQNEQLESILDIVSFSEAIEDYVNDNGGSYISAVLELASELDISDEEVPKLISKSLKDKLELEGIEEGFLRRTSNPMFLF